MLKLILVIVLASLAFALPFIAVAFAGARWCLQKGWRWLCVLAAVLLCIGIGYGLLRFSGIVTFPTDNLNSFNWLDASYRDDGFRYMYLCGSPLVGVVAAFLFRKNA